MDTKRNETMWMRKKERKTERESRRDRERECVAVPFPHQSIVIACFMVIVCALWCSLCPHFYHLKDELEHFSWGNDHSFFHRNANCHAMVTFVRWFSCSKCIHSEWWQRHSNEKKTDEKKNDLITRVHRTMEISLYVFLFPRWVSYFWVQNVGIFVFWLFFYSLFWRELEHEMVLRWIHNKCILGFPAPNGQIKRTKRETERENYFLMCSLSI